MVRKVMEVIHPCVGGLDVHKKTVMACRRRLLAHGQVESEVRELGTSTAALRQLAAWLAEWSCTHVAMEATGVLWVPVWNVLEGSFQWLLANARHWKKVPGRQRDVSDAEWIAQLMPCGLLKARLVPSREMRPWRTLTRQQMKRMDQHTAVVNRLHKVLQQGNIKQNRSGQTPKGNRWLRRVLVEPAWGAARREEGYLGALYRRIARRRGDKRAVVAVARTILQAAWHVLKEGVDYKELGGDYFHRLNGEQTKNQLIRRLEKLGYAVDLRPKPATVQDRRAFTARGNLLQTSHY